MTAEAILKRYKYSFVILLVLLATFPLFQNCERNVAFSSNSSTSGNGGTYDGKPDPGTYYRTVPDYRCGGDLALAGAIEVTTTLLKARTLDSKDCQLKESVIDLKSIEFATYNRSILGYGDGIFEKRSVSPDLSLRDLRMTEAWCRSEDATSIDGLDVIVRSRADGAEFSTTTTSAVTTPGFPSFKDTIVIRSLVGATVQYVAPEFELEFDLSHDAGDPNGLKPARLIAETGHQTVDRKMVCRTGGRLDSMVTSPPTTCPAGFVRLAARPGYTDSDVCIAKYEAQSSGGVAVSIAGGTPWLNANRIEALAACRASGSGFDLISNNEWQSLARNIETVPSNWSGGAAGVGALNQGHVDNMPAAALNVPLDDTDPCFGTGQTCSSSIWNSQKRTNQLLSGEIIWDIGGNLSEITRDSNNKNYGPDGHVAFMTNDVPYLTDAKDRFGPAGDYRPQSASPWAGLGYAYLNHSDGAIVRGAGFDALDNGGIFQASLWFNETSRWSAMGFRCVYHP